MVKCPRIGRPATGEDRAGIQHAISTPSLVDIASTIQGEEEQQSLADFTRIVFSAGPSARNRRRRGLRQS